MKKLSSVTWIDVITNGKKVSLVSFSPCFKLLWSSVCVLRMRLENFCWTQRWPMPLKVHQSPCSRTAPFLFGKLMLSREEVYACLSHLHNGDGIHAGANIKDWMWEGKRSVKLRTTTLKRSDSVFNFHFLLRNLMTKPAFCNLELMWMS